MILLHHISIPGLPQPGLCGIEQAHVGAAKPVDRLFRIAHQQHRRACAVIAIGVEPAAQCGPLQRVGVLKFIEQQMLDAGVEPLVQIRRVVAVSEEAGRLPFDVVEVDCIARRLQALIGGDEDAAQHESIAIEIADAAVQQCCFGVLYGA